MKWAEKHARFVRNSPYQAVLFRDFCMWIDEISGVSQSCETLYGSEYMKERNGSRDLNNETGSYQKQFAGLSGPSSKTSPNVLRNNPGTLESEFNTTKDSNQMGYNSKGRNQPNLNKSNNGGSYNRRNDTENKNYFKDVRDQSDSSQARRSTFKCPACNLETEWESNHLTSCDSFAQLDRQQKRNMAERNNYCLKCLRGNHFNREPCLESRICNSCPDAHHEDLACPPKVNCYKTNFRSIG